MGVLQNWNANMRFLPDGLLTSGRGKDDVNIAPSYLPSLENADHGFILTKAEEQNTMISGEDESSPVLNGRLRPRKSTANIPNTPNKSTGKPENKVAQDRPKRNSTPSKVSPNKQDDLTAKADSIPLAQLLCPYCDRKFTSKLSATKHARRIHLSTSKQDNFINCLFCKHSEAASYDIVRHMADYHPAQYFACLNCNTRFCSTSELAEHKLNACDKQKQAYRSKLRQKTSIVSKKKQKKITSDDKNQYPGESSELKLEPEFNGLVISCELKPSQALDAADVEDKITTNLIMPSNIGNTVLDKNAVIILDNLQWNRRMPTNFSFRNADADQILSRLGVVHRSPGVAESTRREWLRMIDDNSQKFEKCFDTNFYSRVASNVQENLARFLDGSFNFSPNPDKVIKTRKSKSSAIINTAEGFPILLPHEQYSRNRFDGYLPRAIAPKHKWKWDSTENEQKNIIIDPNVMQRDNHVDNCIITLVSSLDIWTQLRMRRKFEEIFCKAPTEKIEKQNIIARELKEILESREIPCSSSQVIEYSNSLPVNTVAATAGTALVENSSDFPSFLGLSARATGTEGTLPPAVLSGEWVRPRCYVCCACGDQTRDSRALTSHMATHHPNAQVQHYEIVGESLLNADILKHLYVPPSQMSNRTRPLRGFRDCTKCKKSVTMEDLHQHMLDCAGDTPTVRKKGRSRLFGVRRRRPRLPDNIIRKKIRKDLRTRHNQKGRLRARPRIRTEVGDAETIRKMIADLPAKRHRQASGNATQQVLRPRRKLDKQRSILKIKHLTSKEVYTRKIHAKNEPNDLLIDEDDQPLKPKSKIEPEKIEPAKKRFSTRVEASKSKKKLWVSKDVLTLKESEAPIDNVSSSPHRRMADGASTQRININASGNDNKGNGESHDTADNNGDDDKRKDSAPDPTFLKHSIVNITSSPANTPLLLEQLEPFPKEPNALVTPSDTSNSFLEKENGSSIPDKPPLLTNQSKSSGKKRKSLLSCIEKIKNQQKNESIMDRSMTIGSDPRFLAHAQMALMDPNPAVICSTRDESGVATNVVPDNMAGHYLTNEYYQKGQRYRHSSESINPYYSQRKSPVSEFVAPTERTSSGHRRKSFTTKPSQYHKDYEAEKQIQSSQQNWHPLPNSSLDPYFKLMPPSLQQNVLAPLQHPLYPGIMQQHEATLFQFPNQRFPLAAQFHVPPYSEIAPQTNINTPLNSNISALSPPTWNLTMQPLYNPRAVPSMLPSIANELLTPSTRANSQKRVSESSETDVYGVRSIEEESANFINYRNMRLSSSETNALTYGAPATQDNRESSRYHNKAKHLKSPKEFSLNKKSDYTCNDGYGRTYDNISAVADSTSKNAKQSYIAVMNQQNYASLNSDDEQRSVPLPGNAVYDSNYESQKNVVPKSLYSKLNKKQLKDRYLAEHPQLSPSVPNATQAAKIIHSPNVPSNQKSISMYTHDQIVEENKQRNIPTNTYEKHFDPIEEEPLDLSGKSVSTKFVENAPNHYSRTEKSEHDRSTYLFNNITSNTHVIDPHAQKECTSEKKNSTEERIRPASDHFTCPGKSITYDDEMICKKNKVSLNYFNNIKNQEGSVEGVEVLKSKLQSQDSETSALNAGNYSVLEVDKVDNINKNTGNIPVQENQSKSDESQMIINHNHCQSINNTEKTPTYDSNCNKELLNQNVAQVDINTEGTTNDGNHTVAEKSEEMCTEFIFALFATLASGVNTDTNLPNTSVGQYPETIRKIAKFPQSLIDMLIEVPRPQHTKLVEIITRVLNLAKSAALLPLLTGQLNQTFEKQLQGLITCLSEHLAISSFDLAPSKNMPINDTSINNLTINTAPLPSSSILPKKRHSPSTRVNSQDVSFNLLTRLSPTIKEQPSSCIPGENVTHKNTDGNTNDNLSDIAIKITGDNESDANSSSHDKIIDLTMDNLDTNIKSDKLNSNGIQESVSKLIVSSKNSSEKTASLRAVRIKTPLSRKSVSDDKLPIIMKEGNNQQSTSIKLRQIDPNTTQVSQHSEFANKNLEINKSTAQNDSRPAIEKFAHTEGENRFESSNTEEKCVQTQEKNELKGKNTIEKCAQIECENVIENRDTIEKHAAVEGENNFESVSTSFKLMAASEQLEQTEKKAVTSDVATTKMRLLSNLDPQIEQKNKTVSKKEHIDSDEDFAGLTKKTGLGCSKLTHKGECSQNDNPSFHKVFFVNEILDTSDTDSSTLIFQKTDTGAAENKEICFDPDIHDLTCNEMVDKVKSLKNYIINKTQQNLNEDQLHISEDDDSDDDIILAIVKQKEQTGSLDKTYGASFINKNLNNILRLTDTTANSTLNNNDNDEDETAVNSTTDDKIKENHRHIVIENKKDEKTSEIPDKKEDEKLVPENILIEITDRILVPNVCNDNHLKNDSAGTKIVTNEHDFVTDVLNSEVQTIKQKIVNKGVQEENNDLQSSSNICQISSSTDSYEGTANKNSSVVKPIILPDDIDKDSAIKQLENNFKISVANESALITNSELSKSKFTSIPALRRSKRRKSMFFDGKSSADRDLVNSIEKDSVLKIPTTKKHLIFSKMHDEREQIASLIPSSTKDDFDDIFNATGEPTISGANTRQIKQKDACSEWDIVNYTSDNNNKNIIEKESSCPVTSRNGFKDLVNERILKCDDEDRYINIETKQKRKLNNDNNTSCNVKRTKINSNINKDASRDIEESKLKLKSNSKTVDVHLTNNNDTRKLLEKTSSFNEIRTACYNRPVVDKKTYSTNVSDKNPENYDPYNIDFDIDMVETAMPILKRKANRSVSTNNASKAIKKSLNYDEPIGTICKEYAAEKVVIPTPDINPQNMSDSDSSISDVPLQKYVEEKQKLKEALKSPDCNKNDPSSTSINISIIDNSDLTSPCVKNIFLNNDERPSDEVANNTITLIPSIDDNHKTKKLGSKDVTFCKIDDIIEETIVKQDQSVVQIVNNTETIKEKSGTKQKKKRRSIVSNASTSLKISEETDQQLDSDNFMATFGFYSVKTPRKSNLLASKKISETFNNIENEDAVVLRRPRKSSHNEHKKVTDDYTSKITQDVSASNSAIPCSTVRSITPHVAAETSTVSEQNPTSDDCEVDLITAQRMLESEEIRKLERDLYSGFKQAAEANAGKTSGFNHLRVEDSNLLKNSNQDTSTLTSNDGEINPEKGPITLESPERPESSERSESPESLLKDKPLMYPEEEVNIYEDKYDIIKRRREASANAKQVQKADKPKKSKNEKSKKKPERKNTKKSAKKTTYQASHVPTKGALKGFDGIGIKISIPTQDLNMPLSLSPPHNLNKTNQQSISKKQECLQNARKSYVSSDSDLYSKGAGIQDVYEFQDDERPVTKRYRLNRGIDKPVSSCNENEAKTEIVKHTHDTKFVAQYGDDINGEDTDHKTRKAKLSKGKGKGKGKGKRKNAEGSGNIEIELSNEGEKISKKEKLPKIESETNPVKVTYGSTTELSMNLDYHDEIGKTIVEDTLSYDYKNTLSTLQDNEEPFDDSDIEEQSIMPSTSGFVPDRNDESSYDSDSSSSTPLLSVLKGPYACTCLSEIDSDDSETERGCAHSSCRYSHLNAAKNAVMEKIFKNNAVRCDKSDDSPAEPKAKILDLLFDSLLEPKTNNTETVIRNNSPVPGPSSATTFYTANDEVFHIRPPQINREMQARDVSNEDDGFSSPNNSDSVKGIDCSSKFTEKLSNMTELDNVSTYKFGENNEDSTDSDCYIMSPQKHIQIAVNAQTVKPNTALQQAERKNTDKRTQRYVNAKKKKALNKALRLSELSLQGAPIDENENRSTQTKCAVPRTVAETSSCAVENDAKLAKLYRKANKRHKSHHKRNKVCGNDELDELDGSSSTALIQNSRYNDNEEDEEQVAEEQISKIKRSLSRKSDEGISTSHDNSADAFDTGVAVQRARRKCTVGKQNVLAEHWSSSESDEDSTPMRVKGRKNSVNKKKPWSSSESDEDSTPMRVKGRKNSVNKKNSRIPKKERAPVRPRARAGNVSPSEPGPSRAPHKPQARSCAAEARGTESGSDPDYGSDCERYANENKDVEMHGWIVGDSHKKLVMRLACNKSKKRRSRKRRRGEEGAEVEQHGEDDEDDDDDDDTDYDTDDDEDDEEEE